MNPLILLYLLSIWLAQLFGRPAEGFRDDVAPAEGS